MTIEFTVSTEAAIAKTYKEELEVKLLELCALMNTALCDDFRTKFQIGFAPDGRYNLTSLTLIKHF